jgi:hypothetical protein
MQRPLFCFLLLLLPGKEIVATPLLSLSFTTNSKSTTDLQLNDACNLYQVAHHQIVNAFPTLDPILPTVNRFLELGSKPPPATTTYFKVSQPVPHGLVTSTEQWVLSFDVFDCLVDHPNLNICLSIRHQNSSLSTSNAYMCLPPTARCVNGRHCPLQTGIGLLAGLYDFVARVVLLEEAEAWKASKYTHAAMPKAVFSNDHDSIVLEHTFTLNISEKVAQAFVSEKLAKDAVEECREKIRKKQFDMKDIFNIPVNLQTKWAKQEFKPTHLLYHASCSDLWKKAFGDGKKYDQKNDKKATIDTNSVPHFLNVDSIQRNSPKLYNYLDIFAASRSTFGMPYQVVGQGFGDKLCRVWDIYWYHKLITWNDSRSSWRSVYNF